MTSENDRDAFEMFVAAATPRVPEPTGHPQPAAAAPNLTTPVAGSIVMCFLTVPAEAYSQSLSALADEDAVSQFPGSVAAAATSFVESGGTQLEDSELILVSAQAPGPPTTTVAEEFWRAVESTLFRAGVSTIQHMVAYAIPAEY